MSIFELEFFLYICPEVGCIRKIFYDISYVQNLKTGTNELFTNEKQNQRCRKQTNGYQGQKVGWGDKLEDQN